MSSWCTTSEALFKAKVKGGNLCDLDAKTEVPEKAVLCEASKNSQMQRSI